MKTHFDVLKGEGYADMSLTPIKRIDWAKDYEMYNKLTLVQQRKMLRRLEQAVPLKQMTYEQAKLFHRLKGRVK